MINVLIVDDDRFARMGLISMIPWEKYGMKIVGEAANGKRALEFIQENPVNLMFVDIAMPVMDGIELIRQVKEKYRQIHFVVLTFHEDFEYIQEALRLGALDYISKDKMELEDYSDIMCRIRRGIADDINCFEAESENEQFSALEQALEGVLWLYDNYQTDRAAQLLQAGYIHTRSLEKLFAAVMARVSADTQVQFGRVPHLENMQIACSYLRDCREQYRVQILAQNDTVHARLMMAAEYIWRHSTEPIQATDVADSVNYSRSYFSVSFKRILGITFNAFVRRERIRNAMELLRNTALPQAEIARRCGYGDTSNFKNAFREVAGCFPGRYRAICSENKE